MSTLTDEDLTALLDGLGSSYDVPEHGPGEVLAALAEQPAPVPLVRRRWLQLSAAASIAVVGLVAAAALSGGGATDAQLSAEGGSTSKSVAPQRQLADRDSAGTTQDVAAAPLPAAAPGGEASTPATGATGAVGAPAPDAADSRVVKTGTIALVVKDRQVSTTISAVQRAATAQGGYIASSTSNEYGETPTGEVTIRVPVARFENLVAAVRGLAEVRTATTSGKDVTAQYADLEAQLRTLKATRERFLVILSQTKTISEILTVQQRVDTVSGQIDRLEGSRKLLESQSDLSTLTVSVSEKDDPVVRVQAQRGGLSQALHDAKDGFVTGVEGIVRHSGRALLWLLCLGGVALLARASWKVARRRLV
jgi:hypothetical protein